MIDRLSFHAALFCSPFGLISFRQLRKVIFRVMKGMYGERNSKTPGASVNEHATVLVHFLCRYLKGGMELKTRRYGVASFKL